MAILKLKPSGKDYIWGGHKLVDNYGKEMTGDRLAETWELSCHPDGPSFVANGEAASSIPVPQAVPASSRRSTSS